MKPQRMDTTSGARDGARATSSPGDLLPAFPSPPGREDPREVAARAARLTEEFFKGKSRRTVETYREGLQSLADFLGFGSLGEGDRFDALALVRHFAGRTLGAANDDVTRWKNDMIARRRGNGVDPFYSPRTVNVRLSAARSLVKYANFIGVIPWTLGVKGLKVRRYLDTAGPPREVVQRILTAAAGQEDPLLAARDVLLLRLLFDQAFRRAETLGGRLRWPDDVDEERGVIRVLGKGRDEREEARLSAASREALAKWLEVRGREPGPLVWSLAKRSRGKALLPRGVNSIVRALVVKAGLDPKKVRVTPHGFRHSSITTYIDATGGDVLGAQSFARQSDPRITMLYYDNLKKKGAGAADVVSDALARKMPDDGP